MQNISEALGVEAGVVCCVCGVGRGRRHSYYGNDGCNQMESIHFSGERCPLHPNPEAVRMTGLRARPTLTLYR